MEKASEEMLKKNINYVKENNYESRLLDSIVNLISKVQVFSRVKTIDSAIEKYERKNYFDVSQIEDILGIMLIVKNKKDLYNTAKIIKSNYQVIKIEDYIKDPKKYGYQSYHMVIQFYDIKAEIQIKTEKMKKASDITHDIYKSSDRNKFITLKALFSAVL